MKLSELIMLFIAELDVSTYSRMMYDFSIRKFFRWVQANNKDYEKLSRADIINYKSYLHNSKLSVPSVKNYLSVVRVFYAWAEEYGHYDNIAAGIKSPKNDNSFKKYPLSFEEQYKLLQIERKSERGARDFALITLLLNNGLRRSEVVSINIGDVQERNNNWGICIKGKGRDSKDQWIMLIEDTLNAIHEYLVFRNDPSDDQPLFSSLNYSTMGKRLDMNSVSKIVKAYLVAIGLDSKYYTCHSLRHTTACNLMEKNLDITQIQRFMRHNSLSTTQLYTRVMEEKIMQENPAGKIIQSIRNQYK